jgi:hypothetical protein
MDADRGAAGQGFKISAFSIENWPLKICHWSLEAAGEGADRDMRGRMCSPRNEVRRVRRGFGAPQCGLRVFFKAFMFNGKNSAAGGEQRIRLCKSE